MTRILIDHRERNAGMARALLSPGRDFDAQWATLSLGDYLIDEQLLIERKSMLDLCESIKDGRLFAQAQRMAGLLRRNRRRSWQASVGDLGSGRSEDKAEQSILSGVQACALLIEGTTRQLGASKMDLPSIRAALATVSVLIGVPVLRTATSDESVALLLSLSRQLRTIAHGALPRAGVRPTGKRGVQLHLLQGLPGVGPRRAAGLLQRFGSVRAAVHAGEAEIAGVDGIGEETARKIVWSVSDRRGTYRPDAARDGATQ